MIKKDEQSALRRPPRKRPASASPLAGMPVDRVPPADAFMTHWTIYDHPKDAPRCYVLRATFILKTGGTRPDAMAWYASDVEALRAIVPPGLVRFMPGPADDAVILETWL